MKSNSEEVAESIAVITANNHEALAAIHDNLRSLGQDGASELYDELNALPQSAAKDLAIFGFHIAMATHPDVVMAIKRERES